MEPQTTPVQASACFLPDIFRFDKNFCSNMSVVSSLMDSDGSLLRCLLYYLSDQYQHNIFGFGIFDVDDFAMRYGFSEDKLRRRHPSPYHLQNVSEDVRREFLERVNALGDNGTDVSDGRIYDSVIENALYVLHTKPLSFDVIGGAFLRDGTYKKSGSILVIRTLNAVRKGPKGKICYEYTLDTDFMANLSTYYNSVNKKILLALRRKNLDPLYLFINELRTNLGLKGRVRTDVTDTPAFDYLCDLAGIPRFKKDGTPFEPKYRKRNLLAAIETVKGNSDLRFELEWERAPYSSSAYIPVFRFDEESMTTWLPGSGRRDMIAKEQMRDVLRNNILRDSLEFYRRGESANDASTLMNGFDRWFFNPAVDKTEKVTAFRNAYMHTFNRLGPTIDETYSKFAVEIEAYRREVPAERRTVSDFLKVCRVVNK